MTDKEIQEIRAIISSFSEQDVEEEKPNSNKKLSEENEFIPQIDGGDGFYYAKLVKRQG